MDYSDKVQKILLLPYLEVAKDVPRARSAFGVTESIRQPSGIRTVCSDTDLEWVLGVADIKLHTMAASKATTDKGIAQMDVVHVKSL